MKDSYSQIAQFFDDLVGERTDIDYIKNLVQRYHPRAKSILEIACGTGTVLEQFAQNFEVEGLDLSSAMLKIARKRFGPARFWMQDMRSFSTGRTYDVILCVFNSINHLHKFSDWQKVFRSAFRHLNPGGILIFDLMTIHGLQDFLKEPAVIQRNQGRMLVLNYTAGPKQTLNMNVRIFEELGEGKLKGKFNLSEGVISEKSFPRIKVKQELCRYFQKCQCVDPERKRGVHKFSEVIYFIATKK